MLAKEPAQMVRAQMVVYLVNDGKSAYPTLPTAYTTKIYNASVTCFGTKKCSWSKGHPSGCFKCSSLLACIGTAFNSFSNWSFPHTPCSFPLSVSCRLLSRNSVRTMGNFSLYRNKLGFLKHIKRHTCSVGTWKCLT